MLFRSNVLADRGSEQSRIFQGGGLVYRILDEDGKPVGVPIKASDFYNKPTLKFLEEKYIPNDAKRQPFKSRVKNEIDRLFIGKTPTLDEVVKQLERKGIHVALRQNDAGLIYGITYVDHQARSVFNGSALGKPYSAKAIQERCGFKETVKPDLLPQLGQKTGNTFLPSQASKPDIAPALQNTNTVPVTISAGSILDSLLQPEQAVDYVPGQLKKKSRKKKKRKNISNNQ